MHFRYEGNDRNFPLLLHFLEREISQLPRDVKSALKKVSSSMKFLLSFYLLLIKKTLWTHFSLKITKRNETCFWKNVLFRQKVAFWTFFVNCKIKIAFISNLSYSNLFCKLKKNAFKNIFHFAVCKKCSKRNFLERKHIFL